MKNIFKGIFSTIVILTCASSLHAVEDTPISQLTPEVKAAEIENLDQQEDARKKAFEAQLGFTIPAYTDNPSYVITFKDPSADAKGVQLEIDNDRYVEIKSPYTFPALSIGQHHLSFKFTDKDGALQELEYDLSVLPRPPIIKTPSFTDSSISLSGTGLANSEILLFLSSNTNSYPKLINVDAEGNWKVDIEPEGRSTDGVYTVVAYTRKYGYASNLSEPVVFQVGNDTTAILEDIDDNIFFSFASINTDNIQQVASENKDLLILLGVVFLLGILVAFVLRYLITDRRVDLKLKSVEQSIKSVGKTQEKTLREVFEGKVDSPNEKKTIVVEKQTKKIEKVEPIPVVEKKDDKVISKEEFLRKFKMIDPDDNKGKEKPLPTATKKDIKISLTSHQEE